MGLSWFFHNVDASTVTPPETPPPDPRFRQDAPAAGGASSELINMGEDGEDQWSMAYYPLVN